LLGPEKIAQIPELETRGRQRLQLFWKRLDEHLQEREFLVGNSITLADIDAFVTAGFAGRIKKRVPEDRRRVHEWLQRIETLLELR
jgi:glutathione S-transferase